MNIIDIRHADNRIKLTINGIEIHDVDEVNVDRLRQTIRVYANGTLHATLVYDGNKDTVNEEWL